MMYLSKCRNNVYIIFSISRFNEVYTWNNVNSCVHNIIVGQLWIEQVSSCLSCLFHVLTVTWGPVHTTPEEFENGGFTLKTRQMFSVHTTPEEFKNARVTRHFGFWIWRKLGKKSPDYRDGIVFESYSRAHEKEKSAFSNSFCLKGDLEKLRFRDGLV